MRGFKAIDKFAIRDCCNYLHICVEDLPGTLESIEVSPAIQVFLQRLQTLLREDQTAFAACVTKDDLRRYLLTWEDGLFREDAQKEIRKLELLEEEANYFRRNIDSITGLESYLEKYPEGQFVAAAQAQLRKRQRSRKVIRIIFACIFIIIAGLVGYRIYLGTRYLDVSTNQVSFSPDAGSKTVTVFANRRWELVTDSESWGRVTINDQEITIHVEENDNTYRQDKILLKSGDLQQTIDILQYGKLATKLSLSRNTVDFPVSGGTETITVSTDGVWEVQEDGVQEGDEWKGSMQINGNQITLMAPKNPGQYKRHSIKVCSGDLLQWISISQRGELSTELSVSKNTVEFPISGGTETITVLTDGVWRVQEGAEWWGSIQIDGNQVTLQASENAGQYKTHSILIQSGNLSQRIFVSQRGASATNLSVSKDVLSFSPQGGSETVTVSTDGIWEIIPGTKSWLKLSKWSNSITIQVEGHSSPNPREDSFSIKSGTKIKTIHISQKGKKATHLSVSESRISVSHTGGRRTIRVDCDDEWRIGVRTLDWIRLEKSGNSIILDIEEYYKRDERSDYFTVVAGDLSREVKIVQSGDDSPYAEIHDVWLEHNIPKKAYRREYNIYGLPIDVPYNYSVLGIHIQFDVSGLAGKNVNICAFFYDEDGNIMRAQGNNNTYKTRNGQATVQKKAYVKWEETSWDDFYMEIPYWALQEGDNKVVVQILDSKGTSLSEDSEEVYFEVYRN